MREKGEGGREREMEGMTRLVILAARE